MKNVNRNLEWRVRRVLEGMRKDLYTMGDIHGLLCEIQNYLNEQHVKERLDILCKN